MATAEREKRALRRVMLGYFGVAGLYGVFGLLWWLRDPDAEVREHRYLNYVLFAAAACSLPLIWGFQKAAVRVSRRVTLPRAAAMTTAGIANGIALCGLIDFLFTRSLDWAVGFGLLAVVAFASVFWSLRRLARLVDEIAAQADPASPGPSPGLRPPSPRGRGPGRGPRNPSRRSGSRQQS